MGMPCRASTWLECNARPPNTRWCGSMATSPVNHSAGPLLEGCEPLRLISIASPFAPNLDASPLTIDEHHVRSVWTSAGPLLEGCEPLRLISIASPFAPNLDASPLTIDEHHVRSVWTKLYALRKDQEDDMPDSTIKKVEAASS